MGVYISKKVRSARCSTKIYKTPNKKYIILCNEFSIKERLFQNFQFFFYHFRTFLCFVKKNKRITLYYLQRRILL